ncbi:MAG TPA: hypothetical protein VKR99_04405 [Candidatus Eremiobacteraceae bacterium]|nr:hypothetical protein [Candidatus Eremiobacteraceae bacterium]
MVKQASGSIEQRGLHAAALGIGIRAAAAADAATLARLLAPPRERSARALPPTAVDIELLLQSESGGMLVFEVVGTIAGAIGYTLDGDAFRLFNLCVDDASPRVAVESVAGQLVAAAEEIGRKTGASLITAQAGRGTIEFDAFAAAGYVVDYEEIEPAGEGLVAVADFIKLL